MSYKSIKEMPEGEVIVSMVTYKDMVVIATKNRVFRMRDGEAEQVVFKVISEDEA
jgi:hypothetical protein